MPDLPPTLAADPAYLSFARAAGYGNAEDEALANNRIDSINRMLGLNLDDLATQGDLQRSNISASFEDRGMFRSGAREVNLARSVADQGRQAGNLNLAAGDDIASVLSQLIRARAQRARQGAEQNLDSMGNLIQGSVI